MKEIERKYLIRDICYIPKYVNKSRIIQAYISINPEIRIRKIDNTYYRTEKYEGDIVREEKEYKLNAENFNSLLKKAIGIIIKKERYYVELSDKLMAEVDVYSKPLAPLITAEVEFRTIDEAIHFIPPKWFDREVTGEKAYNNKYLALYGAP